MTLFDASLYGSLILCLAGVLWRVRGAVSASVEGRGPSLGAKFASLPGSMFRLLRRPAALAFSLGSLVLRVLFQFHILRASPLRWIMHFSIFTGFLGLTLMHAMDGVVSRSLFSGYEPTLDPYQFLRNLFGAMVLAGLAIAAVRRAAMRKLKRTTLRQDLLFLLLVLAVVASGFLLETAKIMSQDMYRSMVDDYFFDDDPDELAALAAWWSHEFGVVFDEPPPADPDLLERGFEAYDMGCSSCHAPSASAFLSAPAAHALAPIGGFLNRTRAHAWLYDLHILLSFLGLALLPWGKAFHILATPANLLLPPNQALRRARLGYTDAAEGPASDVSTPARALARGLGLSACTRCSVCSMHCSVAPSYRVLGTPDILPSEKLATLARLAKNSYARDRKGTLDRFAEGSFICTECLRCTQLCPAGIELQDLWLASKRELRARGVHEPHGVMAGTPAADWAERFETFPPPSHRPRLTDDLESFRGCVQCTTCTNVCPVVAASDDPARDHDLKPQQIMNLMRMGMREQALGARMVWNCVTCYKCQEHCPQHVKVADVLFELRNMAAMRLRSEAGEGSGAARGDGA